MVIGVPAGALVGCASEGMFWLSMVMRLKPSGVNMVESVVARRILAGSCGLVVGATDAVVLGGGDGGVGGAGG